MFFCLFSPLEKLSLQLYDDEPIRTPLTTSMKFSLSRRVGWTLSGQSLLLELEREVSCHASNAKEQNQISNVISLQTFPTCDEQLKMYGGMFSSS